MSAIPVLVNPSSGRGVSLIDEIRSDPRIRVIEVTPETLPRVIGDLATEGTDRIIVAGGDGTLATAATELARRSLAMGIIPAGTLNHFAKALGIPADAKAALEVALSGHKIPVDVGCLNGQLFLNTSSLGIYTMFVRRRQRLRRWLGYYGSSIVAGIQTWIGWGNVAIELEHEGRARRFRSPIVFLGLGERELRPPHLGERKEEGQRGLHVLVVRRKSRLGVLALAFRAWVKGEKVWGRAKDIESLVVSKCRVVRRRRWSRVAVDGEIRWEAVPLEYQCRSGALTVIAPAPQRVEEEALLQQDAYLAVPDGPGSSVAIQFANQPET